MDAVIDAGQVILDRITSSEIEPARAEADLAHFAVGWYHAG